MTFTVSVPASSANLGPGFDTMALALARYLNVTVEQGVSGIANDQNDALSDGRDLVAYSMEYLSREIGRELPPVSVRTWSDIPVARGMGSSAAAIIGGMTAGNTLLQNPLTDQELLALAIGIEGHADNLAAAMFGGAVLAVSGPGGQETFQLLINLDLVAVVLIPTAIGFTRDARAVVPESLPRIDAVFNSSRCALMVHALASGRPELLGTAMQDRWHQPYRTSLYPYLDAVIDAAVAAGAYGASLSGSGPSVLALSGRASVPAVADAMMRDARAWEIDAIADVVEIDVSGVSVRQC